MHHPGKSFLFATQSLISENASVKPMVYFSVQGPKEIFVSIAQSCPKFIMIGICSPQTHLTAQGTPQTWPTASWRRRGCPWAWHSESAAASRAPSPHPEQRQPFLWSPKCGAFSPEYSESPKNKRNCLKNWIQFFGVVPVILEKPVSDSARQPIGADLWLRLCGPWGRGLEGSPTSSRCG